MDHIEDNNFQISVKALFFNDQGQLMMIQEDNGLWELSGGRIQKGEDFITCLQRECLEEIGLPCEIIDPKPFIVYPTIDLNGRARVMIFFKANFASLEFTPTPECQDLKFFDKTEIGNLQLYPQLKPLLEYI